MMKRVTFGLLPFVLIACSDGPWPAPSSAVIGDLEDFEIVAGTAHQSQDGVGTLVFGDVLVYDESTEMPLNNIEVEFLTNWSGVYVLPETAIKLVQYPQPPEDVIAGTASVDDYCDINEDGAIDSDAPDWCSWWWDTESSSFYEFGGDYAMSSENFQPTYMISSTDSRGVCRFYLYIDSLPQDSDGGSFYGASVWVSIGVDALNVGLTVSD
jgi:hypothetical protein